MHSVSILLFEVIFCFHIFPFHAGHVVSEQAKSTEKMNGVLHDEDLPPQVIKRFAMHLFSLEFALEKNCFQCLIWLTQMCIKLSMACHSHTNNNFLSLKSFLVLS